MTTRPVVSAVQLEVLEAAGAGVLVQSEEPGESYPHWRIQVDEDIWKPVTRTADSLRARNLIAKGTPRADGRVPAVLTDAGRELLADLATRGPTAQTGTAAPPSAARTDAEHRMLSAIHDGLVSRPASVDGQGRTYPFGAWRLRTRRDPAGTGGGRDVTAAIDLLTAAGLVRPSAGIKKNRVFAVLTVDGLEQLGGTR